MPTLNTNFLKLQKNYLFVDIAHRVANFRETHPNANIIRLGIGDVTQPLAPAVIDALHKAVEEQATSETFRGYGPEHGYDFLQKAIIDNDFTPRGVELTPEEVFINDGAKSDTGNFTDILGKENRIFVTDPIYPVYIDSNVMGGRAGDFADGKWSLVTYSACNAENGFIPALPEGPAPDLIYLCYPNNPTGTTLTTQQLQCWVDYALENGSIILYDAAYEAYIQHDNIPHTIYEIPEAKKCAVEFHSFSKTAGFTGLRCGYTIVPKEILVTTDGNITSTPTDNCVTLNSIWNRRQCTKFNGTPYIVQRAAEAIYSPEGKQQIRATIQYYMENAHIMRTTLQECGLEVYGGTDAPYIWLKTPHGIGSWEFFQQLLEEIHVVSTPGVGFGPAGEGYIRLTAFGTRENCIEAMERLKAWMKK